MLLSSFGPHERFKVHAAYEGSELIGALIVVHGEVLRRGRIRFRSVQVAGRRLLESRGAVTEYLDVVATAGREAEVRRACVESILQHEKCAELAIGWCTSGADWQKAISAAPGRGLGYMRLTDSRTSHHADLSGGFERYMAGLSGNAGAAFSISGENWPQTARSRLPASRSGKDAGHWAK